MVVVVVVWSTVAGVVDDSAGRWVVGGDIWDGGWGGGQRWVVGGGGRWLLEYFYVY